MAWNLLKSLESYLGLSPHETRHPSDEPALLDELGAAVDRLKNVTRRIESEQQSVAEHRVRELKEDRLKTAIERAHARMRHSILELHAQLGTGIDEITLHELHTFYSTFDETLIDGVHNTLRQKIQCAIVSRFHRETGPLCWQRLQILLQAQNLEWPRPDGLSPSATPDEIAAAQENNRHRDELAFLEMPISQSAAILVGVVKIWQASYPQPDSSLYRETAYLAVASALRVRLVEKAVSITLAESDSLVGEIESVLAQELDLVRKALQKKTLTLEEAYHASQVTSEACSRIIPQLVWARVKDGVIG